MSTKEDTIVFNIRVTPAMLKALRALAAENYRTAAAEARLAITKHIEEKAA